MLLLGSRDDDLILVRLYKSTMPLFSELLKCVWSSKFHAPVPTSLQPKRHNSWWLHSHSRQTWGWQDHAPERHHSDFSWCHAPGCDSCWYIKWSCRCVNPDFAHANPKSLRFIVLIVISLIPSHDVNRLLATFYMLRLNCTRFLTMQQEHTASKDFCPSITNLTQSLPCIAKQVMQMMYTPALAVQEGSWFHTVIYSTMFLWRQCKITAPMYLLWTRLELAR